MRVIFMGTPDYAEAILAKLIDTDGIDVVAVYTQPDKPVGRKKILTPPVVKTLALDNNIDVYQPNRLRDEDVVNELLKIECDYIVVAAYGQILPKAVLEHAPCINLHASILPQYRGASPIQQSLLNNDAKTGVTAMLMDEGLDTGDIIKIEEIEIPKDMIVGELFDALTKIATDLTVDVVQNYDNYTPVKQDDSNATHCTKITKANGLVEFEDAYDLYNKYRAYTPWPGIYLQSGLKLKQISLLDSQKDGEAGKIISINENSVDISCLKGSIRIYKVQPQSKKEMDVISYINGKRLSIEDNLS
ncbi:methionyl-tRNA formyltransferase [Sulfurimonas lithotrophica]|uniref:Methionyl-tRNA formyltransferase n=1 Tax=Sulfurimonas lithotrophica TaxID=2590022 RepID=A0A5P8P085_9BACT|nr:methionyl-tRNA formyltransferase [Sulfurimonas lithotrophica]QFR48987.1 methionyl-tRNA formyltransferase [Sulfurimonas lithotrophica]